MSEIPIPVVKQEEYKPPVRPLQDNLFTFTTSDFVKEFDIEEHPEQYSIVKDKLMDMLVETRKKEKFFYACLEVEGLIDSGMDEKEAHEQVFGVSQNE